MTAPPIKDTVGRPAIEIAGTTADNSTAVQFTAWAPVANQAARLALTLAAPGDVVTQIDTGETYILAVLPPATNANWMPLGVTWANVGLPPTTLAGISAGVLADAVAKFISKTVASIVVTPLVATVSPGGSVQLFPVALDSANNPVTNKVLGYAVSDPTLLSVSATGLVFVLGLSSLPATVTVFCEDGSATMIINASFGGYPALFWYTRDSYLSLADRAILASIKDVSGNGHDLTSDVTTIVKPRYYTSGIGPSGFNPTPGPAMKLPQWATTGVGRASFGFVTLGSPTPGPGASAANAGFNGYSGKSGITLFLTANYAVIPDNFFFSTPDHYFEFQSSHVGGSQYKFSMGSAFAIFDLADIVLTGFEEDQFVWEFVYDGAGATNSDRLQILANGVQFPLTFTGTIPSVIPAISAGLQVARGYGQPTSGAAGRTFLGHMGDFVGIDGVVSSANRTPLRNALGGKFSIPLY